MADRGRGRGRGRPSKFTPEVCARLVENVMYGGTDKDAAEAAGVDHTTLRLWLLKGERDGEGAYFDFFSQFIRARDMRKLQWLKAVNVAVIHDWKAAQWLLAVHHPEQFSQGARDLASLLEGVLRRVSPEAAAEVLAAMGAVAEAGADGGGDLDTAETR